MSLESFLKKTALDPLKRMADDAINSFTRELTSKFENEVDKLFTKGLKSLGLSNSIASKLAARFGDALVNDLADEFFQSASAESNRLSKQEICDNFAPRFAETATSAVDRVTVNIKSIGGVNGNVLQFPLVLGKYYMSLKFREYTRTGPFTPMKQEFKNGINLPIPRSLEDSYNLNIDSQNLGGVGAAADIIMAEDRSNGQFKTSDQAGALGYMLASSTLEKTSKEGASVLGQFLGTIPNPHVAAIFQGVELRPHTFDWTFAPRNAAESAALQEVIRTLQQNALPAYSAAGTAALDYPYLCQIELQPWASEDNPLILYKPALLRNVSINYSPNGIPSFFAGTNLPTFVSLKLDFIEIEYFTSDDYGRKGNPNSKLNKYAEKGEDFLNAIKDGLTSDGEEAATTDGQQDAATGGPPAPTPAPAPTGGYTAAQVTTITNELALGRDVTLDSTTGSGKYIIKRVGATGGMIVPATSTSNQITVPYGSYAVTDETGKFIGYRSSPQAIGDFLAGKVK